MENFFIHKTEEVKNLIKSKGYELKFTPKYSCELNPIEYIFHIWKSRIDYSNEGNQNLSQIIENLDSPFKSIDRIDNLQIKLLLL